MPAISDTGRAVLRDPRAGSCIDDDPDQVLRASTLNARGHVGAERPREYGCEQEQPTTMSTGRR
jgi:hypothetical protein